MAPCPPSRRDRDDCPADAVENFGADLLAYLFEASSDPFLVLDRWGSIKAASAAARATPGLSIGRPWLEWLPPERADEASLALNSVSRGSPNASFACGDGREVDLRPLRVDGRDVGAILAFCRGAAAPGGRTGEGGVPESKDEIARAREQIEELRWELARSERLQALGEFVTVIVHDLNNVFASVASALRLIGRASGQGALFALASEGTNVLDRGARLVRQMHDFARGSSEDAAPISASVALDRLSGLIRSLAGPAIVVEIGAAEDVGTIWTSSNRLDSVILGLTANALEAMPAGGRLEISARNADASDLPLGLPVGPFMRLDFVHTGGAGSPEAAYDALRPTPKRRGRGAGLGLASVFRFAAETGGRCVVTSAVGGSIEVTLFLPRGTAFTAHGMDSDAESAEAGEV